MGGILQDVCGVVDTGTWWIRATLNPCFFELGATTLLLLAMAINLFLLRARFRQCRELKAEGHGVKGPKGITGSEGGYAAASIFLATLHFVHLLVGITMRLPLFHVVLHGMLCMLWLLLLGLSLSSSKVHVPLDFRAFACTAWLVYVWTLYSFFRLYTGFDGGLQ